MATGASSCASVSAMWIYWLRAIRSLLISSYLGDKSDPLCKLTNVQRDFLQELGYSVHCQDVDQLRPSYDSNCPEETEIQGRLFRHNASLRLKQEK
jgi:hypothetical protein